MGKGCCFAWLCGGSSRPASSSQPSNEGGEREAAAGMQLELDPATEASVFNMLLLPPICTVTFYRGSASAAIPYVRQRVKDVITANPWLAGRLRRMGSCLGLGRLILEVPAARCIALAEYFLALDEGSLELRPDMAFSELTARVLRSPAGLKTGFDCIGRDRALFRVVVAPAGPDHFALVVALNHTIGDGFTYYKLYGMLDAAASVVSLEARRDPLFAAAAREAIGLRQFDWLTSWGTLLGGLVHTLCRWQPPAPEVRFVCRERLREAKRQACAANATAGKAAPARASTNDVLTSHLFQASKFQYAYMSINLRNRGVCKLTDANAGNYLHRVHLWPEDFADPRGVRSAISARPGIFRGARDDVPSALASLAGLRHGLISNWASLHVNVDIPEAEQILHLPVLPYPMPGFGGFLIFRPTREELAVYYALRSREAMAALESSSLLGQRVLPLRVVV